ncbi:MAG: thiamine biosynthesis protein ThiH [Leptospiraceae bacterium]|nr:MAG: thiamine biosynthesis protein ThiH [Leptospiraceae bacterium]
MQTLQFSDYIKNYPFEEIKLQLQNINQDCKHTKNKIENILNKSLQYEHIPWNEFLYLISTPALEYLEPIAQIAYKITRKRFGKAILIYAPLYLSNECKSICTYCGFSYNNPIKRRTLSIEEAYEEAMILHNQGIRHILLLTGEDYRNTPVSYIGEVAEKLKNHFSSIGIEVYPLKEEEYKYLRTKGVDSLTIYQETYDPIRYKEVHLQGVKKRMEFRLNCPDRGGLAGLRKIGIGALMGLSDPQTEVAMVGLHAQYLLKKYWKTHITISLPRLKPAENFQNVPVISDKIYVLFLCALRIFLPDVGLILSTRESPYFRDHVIPICITQISAGSKTEPGGYSGKEATEQFHIEDHRSIPEIVEMLKSKELDPVFTDWVYVMK